MWPFKSKAVKVRDWEKKQVLHVISVYCNPTRSVNRARAFRTFVERMQRTSNVHLYIVEVAYGDRPFEVTHVSDERHLQLRAKDVLWIKENAINLAVQKLLPKDAKYAAYVDGDFQFSKIGWALEAISLLQTHAWVQLFSGYGFMTSDHRPVDCRPSFAFVWQNHIKGNAKTAQKYVSSGATPESTYRPYGGPPLGAVGGGWAWRMDSWPKDGFIDFAILGSADVFHVCGLVNLPINDRDEIKLCSEAYATAVQNRIADIYAAARGSVGCVSNFATHEWHGDWSDRGYETRWQILKAFDFDPTTDITHDKNGLVCWTGNKPELEAAVRQYFTARNEDSTTLSRRAMY